jgi:hypothetical protein
MVPTTDLDVVGVYADDQDLERPALRSGQVKRDHLACLQLTAVSSAAT